MWCTDEAATSWNRYGAKCFKICQTYRATKPSVDRRATSHSNNTMATVFGDPLFPSQIAKHPRPINQAFESKIGKTPKAKINQNLMWLLPENQNFVYHNDFSDIEIHKSKGTQKQNWIRTTNAGSKSLKNTFTIAITMDGIISCPWANIKNVSKLKDRITPQVNFFLKWVSMVLAGTGKKGKTKEVVKDREGKTVGMYVCMYVRAYVRMYVCMRVRMYESTYVCM